MLKSRTKKFDYRYITSGIKVYPKKIIIRSGDLGVNLSEFGRQIGDKNSWKTSLGILITLFVAKFTTDFKKTKIFDFELTVDTLQVVSWVLITVSILWLMYDIYIYFRNKNEIIDLLNLITQDSINKADYTTVFIAVKKIDNEIAILVRYKNNWSSHFLPYLKRPEHFNLRKSIDYGCYINNGLGFKSSQIQEVNFPIVESEKYDPPENIVKEFYFKFVWLKINKNSNLKGYEWKKLSNLLMDQETMKHNGDILTTLVSHKSHILESEYCQYED